MTIEQLKQYGHDLIEEHMALLDNVKGKSKRERTYIELGEKMKGRSPHFSCMKDKMHVMLAIGMLKKMIFKKRMEKDITQNRWNLHS